jgi:putative addiction module component (TIGR02574 family)
MPEVLEQLKSQASQLSADERAALAEYLLESLEPDGNDAVAAAWEAAISRRVAEIRSGSAVGKPAEQVFAELRERKR